MVGYFITAFLMHEVVNIGPGYVFWVSEEIDDSVHIASNVRGEFDWDEGFLQEKYINDHRPTELEAYEVCYIVSILLMWLF